ncbi:MULTISPECIES: stage V sporulation protein D [unclassified Clostridium]|uniref:stage V sporulation protein D n=1 Tax=unclassified Clostridium TaxID=2614128 RepID=UPI0025C42E2D|nr:MULTISPECIES: stage V sporulation protein D [unclassified Clostridium]
MTKAKTKNKTMNKKRIKYTLLFTLLIFIYISYRLFTIMFIKGDEYKSKGVQQWTNDSRIDAKRGKILDRDENELAVSANVYRVDLDLKALRESLEKKKLTMKQIAPDLAQILTMDSDTVLEILTEPLPNGKEKNAAILKRRIEKEVADKIKAYSKEKDIIGLVISTDTKRYYPNDNLASHAIGHTNSDGEGLTGIELYYNKYLSGIPGIKVSEADRRSEDLPYNVSDYSKPVDGRDVVLTIDQNIQFFADKAAEKALADNNAKAVSITVMNPNNGEILATANKPDYNLNNPWPENLSDSETEALWRNRSVSDAFEPGSIFKVVTATAAIETGHVKENDNFYCNGSSTVGGRTIHCWNTDGHGNQSFQDILKNSCNVGFMTLADRMGKETLNKYIEKYGFGKKTGIDLPGETEGIIKPTELMSDSDLATISFGQSDTVSVVQYMMAFNAVANGGKLITPHLMKEIVHYDEENKRVVDQEFIPKVTEGNFKPETLAEMRNHLEAVVESGASSNAYIPGYHIAGKTGTAEKPDLKNGGYEKGKYIGSFVGMAPANDPKITILITIDEPDSSQYYGGQIAAPVGKSLFYDIFNYLALKPDATSEKDKDSLLKNIATPEVRGAKKNDGVKTLKDNNLNVKIEGNGDYIIDINPKPGYMVKEGTEITVYTGKEMETDTTVAVPDLSGYSKDKASELLDSLGLRIEFDGEGTVSKQSIAPRQHVKKGTVVTVTLKVSGG